MMSTLHGILYNVYCALFPICNLQFCNFCNLASCMFCILSICDLLFSYLCMFAICYLAIFLSQFAKGQFVFAICIFANLHICNLFNVLCSFSARMGAWGPVPCRLGPLPGPLGHVPGGGLDPMSETQTVASPLGFCIEIYDDFHVDLGSFWDRSWVPLGVHFRSSWRFLPSKLAPEPPSNRVIFEKVILHEIVRFPTLWGSAGSHVVAPKRPRSLQDAPLIVLDCFFSILDFRLRLGSF